MFKGCSSLKRIGDLGDDEYLSLSYEGVASGEQYYGETYQMFSGCSSLPYGVNVSVSGSSIALCSQMFNGCSSIVDAQYGLTLTGSNSSDSEGAFEKMFYGCTSLKGSSGTIDVDEVDDAKRMAYQMFCGCTSLQNAETTIPVDIPTYGCYQMFYGCTSLEVVQNLYFETVKSCGCYQMFYGCTSLQDVHFCDFDSVTMVEASAFSGMFKGCTGLKNNPDEDMEIILGYAGSGVSSVYRSMFQGCTGLEGGVVIYATELATHQLREMFSGCTSLRDVTMHYKGVLGGSAWSGRAYNWMLGVQDEGTYHCYRGTDLSVRGTNGIPVNWKVEYLDSAPLVFTAEEANSSVAMQIVKLRQDGSAPTASFECSLDGETWEEWDGSAITLSAVGDKVQIRSAELLQSISNQYGYRNFVLTGKLALDGSVMGLFGNSEVDPSGYQVPLVSSYGLYGLFSGCTSLSSITNSVLEEVYFVKTGQYAMTMMFENCTGLTDLSGITLP